MKHTEIRNKNESNFICIDEAVYAQIVPVEGAEDSFKEIEEGVWMWSRHLAVPTDHMRMEVILLSTPEFTMIPAISYNGNGWGTTPEYVGDRCEGTPWVFASHRSTIPSCTYSETSLISIALMAADPKDSSACSLYLEEDQEHHVLLFPEEEGPKTLQRHFWGEAFQGSMEPETEFHAIIMAKVSDGTRHRYRQLLDFAWRYYGHVMKAPYTSKELYRLAIAFCRYLFEREKDGFAGFTIGAQWYLGTTSYGKVEHTYEISWVGQNASMANAYIWDYKHTGDKEKLDIAIEVLDSWLKFAKFPSGHVAARVDRRPWRYMEFPVDFKPDRWEVGECMYESFMAYPGRKFRRDENKQILLPHDACDNGGAADCYFEAYDLLSGIGIDKPEYLQAAYDICEFALKNQSEEGGFAKSWDEEGNVLAAKGTIGCFLILPLLTAYQKSGKSKYFDSAVKAFDFYYAGLERDGFTTAGALDTYCIDKESSSPLLRDALALYDRTGDSKYLTAAENIAWYLCTWMMHFTIQYPEDSLIGKMKYDTFGSTSVSTAHQALDQYALRDVLSFKRLYELTGNIQWRERAVVFWCNACQCISDGTQYINGRIRPAGAQDEAIFHTRWGRHGVAPFSPSQWLPAWPTAFRLENLRFCLDWDFFDEGLSEIHHKIGF